ncbi:MAG: glutaredoxin 3 [Gammaproteobacteria bacterium]|nr:glutaredoxin 3 [Gammaproteobacteria bacterium]
MIKVYTIEFCPYCSSAKALLTHNNIPFEEIHFDKNNQEKLNDLVSKSGMRTFPQIFNGDSLIGGYTELKKLHDDRGLKNVFL